MIHFWVILLMAGETARIAAYSAWTFREKNVGLMNGAHLKFAVSHVSHSQYSVKISGPLVPPCKLVLTSVLFTWPHYSCHHLTFLFWEKTVTIRTTESAQHFTNGLLTN